MASLSTLTPSIERLELNSDPDEAAHYVTAVMISEYAAEGASAPPRAFAERYYIHYPKIAFGIWPPLFHLTLGGWLLLTGASVTSALLFMALTTTVLAFVMFVAVRRSIGTPLALASALWFATLPGVQLASSSVMMDMLCTLFMVGATVGFGRYLEGQRTKHALVFAVLAALAMLTKYNALAMALVPPIAILASRRWDVMKRLNFWMMPVVVAAICAPWYISQWGMVRYAADPVPPPGYSWLAAAKNLDTLADEVGLVTLPLMALGLYAFVFRRRGGHGVWCSLVALMVAVFFFHSFAYPVITSRYLLGCLAAMVLLAAAGVHYLVLRLVAFSRIDHTLGMRLAAATVALVAVITWDPQARHANGFADAAEMVLDRGVTPDVTTLVSSGGIGEGAFIAHVATRELKPKFMVLRGSKLLSSGTWMDINYSSRYADAPAMLDALNRARVQYVVLDNEFDRPHHQLLEKAISASPEWRLLQRVESTLPNDALHVSVYARVNTLPPGTPDFELNTIHSLGYNIKGN